MSNEKQLPKELFFKNKNRSDIIPEPPTPEYERLERYPLGYDVKQGKHKSSIMFSHDKKKVMKDFEMHKQKPPAQPVNVGTVSGHSEDQLWNRSEVSQGRQPQTNPNQEEFRVGDVPDPPQVPEMPFDVTGEDVSDVVSFSFIHEVPNHSILLIVREEAFYCSSLEEAEEQVEYLVFQSKVPPKEISIIYKPELKMGTFVKSKL